MAGGWCRPRAEQLPWLVPEASELPRRLPGGLLMGFGGTVAGGCDIGNALTDLSILSLNSLVAAAGILFGISPAGRLRIRMAKVDATP
ncbi:MAG: YeeE/YedE family protein [Candidatus Tectomicrobia bacterium]|uniref:YeeE/YedE family protein n=1 Tax=Tectimicrobiota bacterium TaxID=2528274 RepID=A0A932GPU9_UNCTE|nr:YeeE/YedE family protein [Candidatus Tectomicrobia bacterium]